MKLIPNWQEQDLSCTFCGTKKSVKYELEIHDFESDVPKIVCACNMCVLTRNKQEPVSEGNTAWIEQIIQEGKRRNEIPLAKILMKKGD